MKILIIDDDRSFRFALARTLTQAGYELGIAHDGEHGLAMFHQTKPDLVICDLIMPYRDGIETIAQIRRESPAMKIIAISGGLPGGRTMNSENLAAALELGASEVLMKPLDSDDLLRRVRRVLRDDLARHNQPEQH